MDIKFLESITVENSDTEGSQPLPIKTWFTSDFVLEDIGDGYYRIIRNRYGPSGLVISKNFMQHAIDNTLSIKERFDDLLLEYNLLVKKVFSSDLKIPATQDQIIEINTLNAVIKRKLSSLCDIVNKHYMLLIKTYDNHKDVLETIEEIKSKCEGENEMG